MSHLNTAYKLGSMQAQAEFEGWLRKQSAAVAAAPATRPRAPGTATIGAPSNVEPGSVAEKIRGASTSGMAQRRAGNVLPAQASVHGGMPSLPRAVREPAPLPTR